MPGGGIKEEKFWQSRRIWAATLTLAATVLAVTMPDHVDIWVALTGFIATMLGMSSWTFPKK